MPVAQSWCRAQAGADCHWAGGSLICTCYLQGNVLFVRFYEAEGSGMDRRTPPPTDEYKRLRAAADACVDIPTLMASLPQAIKSAIKQSRTDV